MRSLLDINVIIALLDRGHVMHGAARHWMERELHHGWATCPITQNGVLRIMSPTRLSEPSAGSPGGGAARGSLQPRQPRFLA